MSQTIMRALILGLGGLAVVATDGAGAQSMNFLSTMSRFPEKSGEDLYKAICQGCHMPDAKGAVGAGAYPALAKNAHLETAAYPVSIVLKGQKAMPFFFMQLDDQQVADVVNYVRTHFGNNYRDKVKPEDVKLLR